MYFLTVCSALTVECCVLYPCFVGVFDMFPVMNGIRRLLLLLSVPPLHRKKSGRFQQPIMRTPADGIPPI